MTRLVQTSSKTTVRVCSADPVWSGTSSPPRMKCSVHLSHLVSECTCPSRGLSPRETWTVLGREAGPDSSEGAGSAAPSSCQVQTHILHQGAWLQSSRETQGRFRICLEEIPEPQTVFGGPRLFLEASASRSPELGAEHLFLPRLQKKQSSYKEYPCKIEEIKDMDFILACILKTDLEGNMRNSQDWLPWGRGSGTWEERGEKWKQDFFPFMDFFFYFYIFDGIGLLSQVNVLLRNSTQFLKYWNKTLRVLILTV